MEVERLVAVLEAGNLGGFQTQMAAADRATSNLRGNLVGVRAASGEAAAATTNLGAASAGAARQHEAHARALGDVEKEARGGIASFTGLGRAMFFASNAFLGGAVAGGALKSIYDKTRQAESATTQLRKAVSNTGESWQTYGRQVEQVIARQSQLSDFTQTDLSNAMTRLVLSTGSVTKAEADLALATNLARAAHEDLATAEQQIAMAQTGHLTTLRGLQIAVPRVTTAEDELKQKVAQLAAEHLKATTGSLQHAQAQAKLADQTATAAKMMDLIRARTEGADGAFRHTSEGSLADFHKNIDELQVSIGHALVPQIDNVLGHLSAWIDKLTRTGQAQRDAKQAVDLLKTAIGFLKDAIHVADGVTGSFKHTVELLVGAWAAWKITTLIGSLVGLAARIGGLILGMTGLTASTAASTAAFVTWERVAGGAMVAVVSDEAAVGAAATTAAGEVGGLRAALLGLGGSAVLGALAAAAAAVAAVMASSGDQGGGSSNVGGTGASVIDWLSSNKAAHHWMSQWASSHKLHGVSESNLTVGQIWNSDSAFRAAATKKYDSAGGGTGGTAGSVGGYGHPAGRGGAFSPGPAGGFIPKGQGVTIGRADQGRDIQTGAGDPIIAPGDGYVVRIGSDPGGGGAHFGPAYPIVHFTSGPYAGQTIYIGHTTAALGAGAHFRKGDVLAYTGHGGASSGGAPPGWAEIGFAPGGSPGPVGQPTPFGGASSSGGGGGAGGGLQTVSTLKAKTGKHAAAYNPLIPVALQDSASKYASLAQALSNTGATAKTYLEDELAVLDREKTGLEAKLHTGTQKHRDEVAKALTAVENKIRHLQVEIQNAVVVTGDALLPAGLKSKLAGLSGQFKADSAYAAALTGQAADDYRKILKADLTAQTGVLEQIVTELKTRLASASGKQKTAVQAELAKIETQLANVQQQVLQSLQATVGSLQQQVTTVFASVQTELDAALGNRYFQNGLKTPSEALLASMQAQDQLSSLQDTLQAAKDQLATDQQGALQKHVLDIATGKQWDVYNPAAAKQLAADQKAIGAAQRQLDEYNLSIKASQERSQADAAYAIQVAGLNKKLGVLEVAFENGTGSMRALRDVAAKYGLQISATTIPDFTSLASVSGQLRQAFQDLADYIAKLTGKTPAGSTASVPAASPGAPKTLASGAGQPRLVNRSVALQAHAAGHTTNGDMVVNVNVSALDPAGVDWAPIAEKIQRELLRYQARNGRTTGIK